MQANPGIDMNAMNAKNSKNSLKFINKNYTPFLGSRNYFRGILHEIHIFFHFLCTHTFANETFRLYPSIFGSEEQEHIFVIFDQSMFNFLRIIYEFP